MRVVLAEDDLLVRAGIAQLIKLMDGICVVGEAADGVEALELVSILAPDLVLLDIVMPRMTGIEVMVEISSRFPGVPVLALSGLTHRDTVDQMLQAGAAGYLCKSCSIAELELAIRRVAEGGS